MCGKLVNTALSRIHKRWRHVQYRAYFPIIDRFQERFTRIHTAASIRECIQGGDPLAQSKSAAIYVHYDDTGDVADYVVDQLRNLHRAGFRITFVTNSLKFPKTSRERVSPLCREILWRFNTGLDFGGYKDGLERVGDLKRLDRVVLMNDSVYGPFCELKHILDKVDPRHIDYWGIIDSLEQTPHIQSFFLLFFSAALRSEAFDSFWQSMPLISNKNWVVRNGEIKLSQILEKAGLRGGTLVSYADVAAFLEKKIPNNWERPKTATEQHFWKRVRSRIRGGVPLNPMHHFWDVLILEFDCPFIKRELLRSNPAKIPSLSRWPNVIKTRSSYDLTMIQSHLGARTTP